MNKLIALTILYVCFSSNCVAQVSENLSHEINEENLNILVPDKIYAVEGMPLEIFFDNLILSYDSEKYKYEILVNGKDSGQIYRRKWVFYPLQNNIGKNQ